MGQILDISITQQEIDRTFLTNGFFRSMQYQNNWLIREVTKESSNPSSSFMDFKASKPDGSIEYDSAITAIKNGGCAIVLFVDQSSKAYTATLNSLKSAVTNLTCNAWNYTHGSNNSVLHGIFVKGVGISTQDRSIRAGIGKAFISAIYGALNPSEFYQLANKAAILIIGDSTSGFSGAYVAKCPNLGQFRRAEKIRFSYHSVRTELTPSQVCGIYSGFYLNSGYYDTSVGTEHGFIHNENKFIGVQFSSGSSFVLTVKGPGNSIDEVLMDAPNALYYRLYNANADSNNEPYYVKVNKNGNATSGAAAIGEISVPTISFNIPDFGGFDISAVDYSSGAEIDMKSYIYDFSRYEIHFIPVTGRKERLESLTPSIATFTGIDGNIGEETDTVSIRVKESTFMTSDLELFKILDKYNDALPYILTIKNKTSADVISLTEYFADKNNQGKYDFIYTNRDGVLQDIDFKDYLELNNNALKHINNESKTGYSFNVEMSLTQDTQELNIRSFELFEAFTRGRDFIEENYTIVRPQERDPKHLDIELSRCMNYDENYFTYKYSGRDIDIFCQKQESELCTLPQDYNLTDNYPTHPIYCALIHSADLLLEADVTLGETYGEQKYFIEAIKTPQWAGDNKQEINKDEIKKLTGQYNYVDSFKMVNYLEDGIDPTLYTEDDLEVITSKIDLTRCQYYDPLAATADNNWCDCSYGGATNRECLYQKMGYCPYRFQSEKHPRRIRTLRQSKSNRFNLIQELCKTFKFYPYFYIEHEKNGAVKLDEKGQMLKHVFFMTEKGNTNIMGFRYEKNLSNTTRTIDSSAITTKLYVESVDSNYADDGLCSIQTATDNISRNSYILDFSYYIKMGMLDADTVQRDLYGIDDGDFAFLTRIGKFNEQYDEYSNLIITMTGKTLNELEAEIIVSTTGVTTALEERKKISQQMYQFKASSAINNSEVEINYTTSDTYVNYLTKYREQATILWGLIENLFFSDNYFSLPQKQANGTYTFTTYDYNELKEKSKTNDNNKIEFNYANKYCKGEFFWRLLFEGFEDDNTYTPIFDHWNDCMEIIVEPKLYEINGKLGKYRSLYNEVQYWKRERAKILNKINDLSEQFYHKYEPYLKEGTFTNSNFLTDNEYYWGSVNVLADSCEPKLTYTFSVVDISALPNYKDDYVFELADTTFVEDIDFFGINSHTGFPNKEQVLITALTENLDNPSKNSIEVKNYTSSFDDLFGSITASVQSLTYNENIYKRASNFTAQQYVTTESLQDTLDIGDLTLLDTAKQNIQLDEEGTEGNDINNTASQYKQTGEGIFFSTDGGETWDLGIGPKGINMDYAKFGNLDASKIQIVDGDYIYFLWDKDGINAYRDPSASTDGLLDFARFNRYGLSLIENGNIRLRAGYEYRSNEFGSNSTGDYTQEIPLKDQNVGFYLYNDSGQPIFKTETQSSYSDETADYSARLSLTGEMFVTNKILDSGRVENYSNIKYSKVLNKEWLFEDTIKINSYTGESSDSDQMLQYSILKLFDSFNKGDFIILEYDNGKLNYNKLTDDDIIYKDKIYLICQIGQVTPASDNITNSYPDAKFVQYIINEWGNFYRQIDDEDGIVTTFDKINNDNLESLISGNLVEVETEDDSILIGLGGDTEPLGYNLSGNGASLKILTEEIISKTYIGQGREQLSVSDGDVSEQTITYHIVNGTSYETKTQNLYVYTSQGISSYWESCTNGDAIGTWVEDFSLSEVGIFINNKKALKVSAGEERDLTNLDNQKISSDAAQTAEALRAILSGAERTFSIVASGQDADGNFVYKNILSILKNGVLYMGGVLTDYYGKDLDIEDLSYLPDEVRILQPSLMMTNAGQIWCNWSQFFNISTENGKWEPTTHSLQEVFDSYNEAFETLTTELTQYFSDLQDAINNASYSYGSDASGYYIEDPA